jgi:hypothetical protein
MVYAHDCTIHLRLPSYLPVSQVCDFYPFYSTRPACVALTVRKVRSRGAKIYGKATLTPWETHHAVAPHHIPRSATRRGMASSTSWHLLPPELLELQIGQIDLLMAMYPEDITLDGHAQRTLDSMRSIVEVLGSAAFSTPPAVSISLNLSIADEDGREAQSLQLDITAPFTYEDPRCPDEPPNFKVRIQQPSWLNRAATNQLQDAVPEGEDLLGTLEYIKEAAALAHAASLSSQAASSAVISDDGPLVRVWFYFPSISTRSKRDDFIKFAPAYNLTGFLYAGKPGLLCVEGSSQSIDEYMRFIKTESWGDIPAHHKKVSERYREVAERVFGDMTEITDTVGERRGQRQNRGDMKAVEEWLDERGLKDALTKVLM